LKGVEDLENVYQKKLTFENEKLLQIEQKLLEERIKYDKSEKEMEENNL